MNVHKYNVSTNNAYMLPSDPPGFATTMTVFSILVIIVGFLGNMAAIITMCKQWSSLKSTEVFIFILAFNDLLLSCIAPVLGLNELGVISNQLLNDSGCQFLFWFLTTLNTQSTWIMVAIAVDRFIMIVVEPCSFRRSTNKWKILLINIVIFILASPVGALYFYRVVVVTYGNSSRCSTLYLSTKEDLIHSSIILGIQMAIPAFILTSLYAWMIIELRKPVEFQENIRATEKRKQQNWQVIRIFLSIIVIFYVTALPPHITYMIYEVNQINRITWTKRKLELFYYTYITLRAISNLNYCIDPFIYACLYMTDIKGKIRNTFLRHRSPTTDLRETHPMQAASRPISDVVLA